MSVETDDLRDVYGKGQDALRETYDGWAETYDAELIAKGFRLPALAAALAARHLPKEAGPILDAACGTGQVGEAMRILGYDRLVGLDMTEAMLSRARETGAYKRLETLVLGEPIPEPSGKFAGFICTGAFGPGHAPPESLDELTRLVRPGGVAIFNVVEKTWQEQGFPEIMDRLTADGRWREIERSPAFRAFLLAEPDLYVRLFAFRVR